MVRKKMSETVHGKETGQDKYTDSKDNKEIPIVNEQEEDKTLIDGAGMGQNQFAGETLQDTPDKVVAEGRSFEEKLAEMQDRYIRIAAEFDNYRKRTLREKMEITKYAGEDLLVKLLPVMDDFERALKHMEVSPDCQSLKDGLDLIYSKFSDFLKQQGIREIEALNKDFNFDLHEAVAKAPAPGEDSRGKVVEVILKGYFLHDKVVRHTKVVVGE
ncbi:MAG TPA: nucleotide exchange factor GrpE [Bacteroidales bacterium]|nr:nucleotide exchange factor GrpE [Bacteroidales bacterium]HPM17601.1 nucleotide exchange factor GrpE [Bacteroidales bacterium]